MAATGPLFDAQERLELCDLFVRLGPSAPTLLDGWTATDLAAHLVVRERDPLAGPCLVLPGPFGRFAARRQDRLAGRRDFAWLVERLRSGPPIGFFRLRWVRSLPTLNELFVHHEDLRRANSLGPRSLVPEMEAALWRNVRRSSRYLTRRLRGAGLAVEWPRTGELVTIRSGEPTARLSGPPGELLLYVFGRQAVAEVDVVGPPEAVASLRRTHLGM
ncbi:MAG TPA: TIGR03085 family metal-binding protein [Acidimicrobiales bacterium]|nr:TIGR03085 family metal-binding protein [Acidimicrobiales bacterium]